MFGVEWKQHEAELAKKRQVRKPSDSVVEMFPQQSDAGTARDLAGIANPQFRGLSRKRG
jgi:hypothetical protein